MIAALIPICVIRLLRFVGREGRGNQPAWFRQALEIARAQFSENITSAGLARQIGTTQAQLARAFRRFQHQSVREFVDDLRMIEARLQLLNSDLSVAQIAQRLGYFDQSHFGRHFRNRFHVSPARFRTIRRGQE